MHHYEDLLIEQEERQARLEKEIAMLIWASLDESLTTEETSLLWLFLLGKNLEWLANDQRLTVRQVKNRLQSAISKVCIVLGHNPVSLERLLNNTREEEHDG